MNKPYLKMTALLMAFVLSGCASAIQKNDTSTLNKINDELTVTAPISDHVPDRIEKALTPVLKLAMPKSASKQLEPRFDLVINDAPAGQVLMGIVSGTRYSMLVHSKLTGLISLSLKDVTVFDVLESLQQLYGYEYKVSGNRIFVEPEAIQTRAFQVNYIVGQRKGTSDLRVTAGSLTDNKAASTGASGTTSSSSAATSQPSSSVTTTTDNDFWKELTKSIEGVIGTEGGRHVIVNSQSGVIMIRAMPSEIRQVEAFLRMTQVAIERQVILEAKILNVQLNNNSQSGVNWSVFGSKGSTVGSMGSVNANTQMSTSGDLVSGDVASTVGSILANTATTALGGPLFAVALQGANFSALLSFLETQGDVQVLSSPRIATINNQKAVLKVGTDEFFVTGISSNTTASTGATTTTPQVTLQPFFSGIALDVTPQVNQDDDIILHIHPSISQVTTVNKQLSLGAGAINLPLASSSISETDSIVRTHDGQVIAIGGLMTESTVRNNSKVPGLGDIKGVGAAFRQKGSTSVKSELVILLKATVVKGSDSWSNDILSSKNRIEQMQRADSESN